MPYEIDLTHQEFERVATYLNDWNCRDRIHSALCGSQYNGYPTEVEGRPLYFQDDFGVVWNRSGADRDIGVVEKPFVCDLENYRFPNLKLDEAKLRREYEEVMRTKGDMFAFTGVGFSMFERAWSLCGMENTLMGMINNPEELDDLLDGICEYNLRILEIASEYEFDGCLFGDDWGQQRGLIMGPEHWRRFIKPRMARMYAKAKEQGWYVMQHSCGDIHEIFPDLIEIGLDCYQTFQPEIYDIEKVKAEYGNSLTFWGGISTQQLLPTASPEFLKEEIVRIMKIMKKNGGYIVAPTHSVPQDVPPENIMAMLEVFEHQEEYLK